MVPSEATDGADFVTPAINDHGIKGGLTMLVLIQNERGIIIMVHIE